MTMWMILIFFRYVGTFFMVMFPPSISHLLVASWLLPLEKQNDNIWPIVNGKVIYQLVAHTLVIQFANTFAKHFNPNQFDVATQDKCKMMAHVVCTRLNCIQIRCYHMWMFIMPSILYHKQPFFKSCDLFLMHWIDFSHLFSNFMCVHPHYIFHRPLNIRISQSFHSNPIHNGRSFGWNIVCINTSLHFPPHHNSPPYLCFYLIRWWYAYYWSCFKCGNNVFYNYKQSLQC